MPRERVDLPYASATTKPETARAEITRILQRYGCESVGFMDDFERGEIVLVFSHRGRQIKMEVSAKGWAAKWLASRKAPRRLRDVQAHKARALAQGRIASNAILRDWVKGQMTAVECGMMPFESVFLPYMITSDGTTLHKRVAELKMLPAPKES